MNWMRFWCVAAAPAVFACVLTSPAMADTEWEERSPYYEDDAWYDISEWLDGNDYNPTDEQFGRWDDEIYDSDSLNYDYDDDNSYGYNDTTTEDDWFYDYWEPDYQYYGDVENDVAKQAYFYHDYDGDGLYDSYTAYYDWDNDGWYEDAHAFTFAGQSATANATKQEAQQQQANNQNQSEQQQSSKESQRHSSQRMEISGSVENMKTVKVRGTDHVVVQVKGQDGKMFAIDLGLKSALKDEKISEGSEITARGPTMKAGEKQIVLAESITIDGKERSLDRQPREFTGKIVDTRKVDVRGQQHTLVVLKTDAGKQRLVDLGRSEKLKELDLNKDAKITIRGVPTKVKDRPLVLGHSVQLGGESVTIKRGNSQS